MYSVYLHQYRIAIIISLELFKVFQRGKSMNSQETKISKAQQKAVNKYVKNNYERINVTFHKGKKDILKYVSEKQNKSVNQYICDATDKALKKDKALVEEYLKSISTQPK